MSDLVGNHIVGFSTRWLIYWLCPGNRNVVHIFCFIYVKFLMAARLMFVSNYTMN